MSRVLRPQCPRCQWPSPRAHRSSSILASRGGWLWTCPHCHIDFNRKGQITASSQERAADRWSGVGAAFYVTEEVVISRRYRVLHAPAPDLARMLGPAVPSRVGAVYRAIAATRWQDLVDSGLVEEAPAPCARGDGHEQQVVWIEQGEGTWQGYKLACIRCGKRRLLTIREMRLVDQIERGEREAHADFRTLTTTGRGAGPAATGGPGPAAGIGDEPAQGRGAAGGLPAGPDHPPVGLDRSAPGHR